jgi:hypothetical protein
MSQWAYALLALIIAYIAVLVELLTTKYPRTYFILFPRGSRALHFYSGIYGISALIVFALFGAISRDKNVQFSGIGLESGWTRAIVIGIGIKAFLNISLFGVSIGTEKSFPIGLASLIHPFEQRLLETIDDDEESGVLSLVQTRTQLPKYADPSVVGQLIRDNIPRRIRSDDALRVAFRLDVDGIQNDPERTDTIKVRDMLQLYLIKAGRARFNQVFSP